MVFAAVNTLFTSLYSEDINGIHPAAVSIIITLISKHFQSYIPTLNTDYEMQGLLCWHQLTSLENCLLKKNSKFALNIYQLAFSPVSAAWGQYWWVEHWRRCHRMVLPSYDKTWGIWKWFIKKTMWNRVWQNNSNLSIHQMQITVIVTDVAVWSVPSILWMEDSNILAVAMIHNITVFLYCRQLKRRLTYSDVTHNNSSYVCLMAHILMCLKEWIPLHYQYHARFSQK